MATLITLLPIIIIVILPTLILWLKNRKKMQLVIENEKRPTKKEWTDYFELVNGREPSQDEFLQALHQGEIQREYETNSYFGWGFLGFLIPLVGLVLFLVWQGDLQNAKKGRAAGQGALVSVIFGLIVVGIYFAWIYSVLN
ncbi:MAG: hypothetical protein LBV19_05825 [Streptococcaceae bacterium]|jgi:ribosomal protein L24E|nr:hypothetical protein [Streptococcaceae bacterium]